LIRLAAKSRAPHSSEAEGPSQEGVEIDVVEIYTTFKLGQGDVLEGWKLIKK
jgi:hypothetical protein